MGERTWGSGTLRYTVDLGADSSYLLSLIPQLGPFAMPPGKTGSWNSSLAIGVLYYDDEIFCC